jgi:hypothetical protein
LTVRAGRYRARVLGAGWTEVVALAAAFAIAVVATPAGISGAVLLPFQVSVLGTPSPAVTPTNPLYNVEATPGALYRCSLVVCYRKTHLLTQREQGPSAVSLPRKRPAKDTTETGSQ